MTANKQLLALAIIIGAVVILAVQRWLLSGEFEMLRKKASNPAFENVERWPLESKKEANSSITKPAMKVILFYTKWFGISKWPGFDAEQNVSCERLTCRFTFNRDEFQRSAALIFHGWDLPSETVLKEVEKSKPSKQRWIYFLMESPVINAGRNPALFNGMFNWTFTYRIESDFFVPYGHYGPLNPDEIDRKPKNYAEGKDKLVAWAVSHCGMLRDGFVKKLLQYIKVDIFGSCANKFNQQDSYPRGSQECHKKLQRYKYLSFENSFCIDYITEKYWETPLSLNMVPVVMGGASYENEQLAIPGSFINVVDFESVEALAKYLMYLNSNDTAYNEYFMWKRKFKRTPLMPGWPCRLCAALNNDSLPAKVYDNLGEFWGVAKTCGRNEDKVRKLIAEAN